MNKAIAVLTMLGVAFAFGILTMIYGWGLEPRSWWWIIGGGIVGPIMAHTIAAIAKEAKRG